MTNFTMKILVSCFKANYSEKAKCFFKKITNIEFQLLIGLIKLKTNAKMETTVCLLCLPEQFKSYYEENCTVVGYGRPSKAALNQFGRGIVMFLSIHTHTTHHTKHCLALLGFDFFASALA